MRKESGRSTTQAVVKVYFFIFGFGFPIQSVFILDFVDFLGLWKFEKGEWEKNWVWVFKHLKNVEDVNRVLKTRFTGGRHVEKVPTQTRSEYENQPSKTQFIVQNRAF